MRVAALMPVRAAWVLLCAAALSMATASAQVASPRSDTSAQPSTTATPVAMPEPPIDTVTGPWMPRSGDAWIDMQLADINVYGARYRGAFIDEIVRYHAAPRALVESLLDAQGWLPGDVYYACALANVAGRPCRAAVALRDASPGDGWQAVAMDLGIDEQQPAIKRLRQAIKASYVHWARPEATRVVDDSEGASTQAHVPAR